MLGVSRMLCLLILAGPFGLAGAAPATTADDAARALHLLGYIGADYPATVDAGKIVDAGEYADVPGFCKSAALEEVRKHGHVLTPGRYVGAEVVEEDDEPFDEKMKRLVATLREQQAEAARLDAAIAASNCLTPCSSARRSPWAGSPAISVCNTPRNSSCSAYSPASTIFPASTVAG